jgi:hypothetical protein
MTLEQLQAEKGRLKQVLDTARKKYEEAVKNAEETGAALDKARNAFYSFKVR